MPVEEAVNLFAANRHWMARVLRGCAESDFARAGQHSERGRMTLAELLTSYVTTSTTTCDSSTASEPTWASPFSRATAT